MQSAQVVTPWDVTADSEGKINYNKLVEQFGCQKIDPELVARVERVTGVKAHPFLRRGIFFAHRSEGGESGVGRRALVLSLLPGRMYT